MFKLKLEKISFTVTVGSSFLELSLSERSEFTNLSSFCIKMNVRVVIPVAIPIAKGADDNKVT